MSLSSKAKNRLIDNINVAFSRIGNTNGTQMPESFDNKEPIAWDLFVAQHLRSLADKRKEAAEKAAAQAGVINDKDTNPLPQGRAVLHAGDVVVVQVEVRKPTERVNVDKLIGYLTRNGVKPSLLDEALIMASTTTKPAHVYTSALVTDEAMGK